MASFAEVRRLTRRTVRQVPGARPLVRQLRDGWNRVRPLPLPGYAADTPATDRSNPWVRLTAQTVAEAATAHESASFVADVLSRLTPCAGLGDLTESRAFYRDAVLEFGRHWRYADLLTTLRAAASLIRPSSYLEIGVLRGRSAAVVAASAPECAIYGFDLWQPQFAGMPNPGPDFVRQELCAVGHSGATVLVSGDSHRTVPAFLREHPDLYFDLVTIDGDKSVLGAATDLANTLPRLKVGGIVVSDDLAIFPPIMRVWEKMIRRDSRYSSWEFLDGEWGVAAAIRLPDQPEYVRLGRKQDAEPKREERRETVRQGALGRADR